jgi:hypothetical protein
MRDTKTVVIATSLLVMARLAGTALPALAQAVSSSERAGVKTAEQPAAKTPTHRAGGPLRSLTTRPERSNYNETSRYDDVVKFMEAVAAAAPRTVHLTTFGYSFEGRPLPLAVVGHVKDASPEAVTSSGKTRIYVQGNIHADEVEGKEACLELLRALGAGDHAAWLDSTVLLIGPIYNADGNEAITVKNRYNSPVGGVGQRANRQTPVNLDLNRDFMKLDSAEARSFAFLMQRYDPHIVIDLHTTDGSIHGYRVTYAPPLHPASAPGIVELARKELLPAVTSAVKAKYGWDYYYYGNFGRQAEPGSLRTFSTTEPGPRYSTNYVGVRNRIGLLSETYSYLLFKDRIAAARAFVEEVCAFASRNGAKIRKASDEADAQPVAGQTIALSGKPVRSAEPVDILVGEVTTVKHPYTGGRLRVATGVTRPEKMYEAISFEPDETTRAPRAYLVPANLDAVLDRLEAHGVKFSRLAQAASLKVERFKIASSTLAERDYQGHKVRTITGAWEDAEQDVPAGTLAVPVDQPLGRLIVLLLEPRSEDSLAAWNLMDQVLEKEKPAFYPVTRTMEVMTRTMEVIK